MDARRSITPAFSENAVALIMPLDGIIRAKERLAGGRSEHQQRQLFQGASPLFETVGSGGSIVNYFTHIMIGLLYGLLPASFCALP